MRNTLLLVLIWLLLPVPPAQAQTSLRLSAGVVRGTKLLGDRVNPFDELYGIDITQTLAPSVQLSISMPLQKKYRFRAEAQLNATTLHVKDGDTGEESEFGKLRTLSLLGIFEGRLIRHFDWQVGVGPIFYMPAEKTGFFQDGGPMEWMVIVGLTRTIPLSANLSLLVSARYDYHQFNTTTLTDRGFSQYQAVQRGGLSFGVERVF